MKPKILLAIILLLTLTFASAVQAQEANTSPVATIAISTDSSWKSMDAEVKGWTSAAFDDSWWPDSWESASPLPGLTQARAIWYAETPVPLTAYFRKSFEISGIEVISGRMLVKICAYGEGVFTMPDMGRVYIYINDQYVDKVTSGGYMNNWWREKDFDITSYLTLGKNVIAVKVEFTESATEPPTVSKYNWWGLDATIRYSETPASPLAPSALHSVSVSSSEIRLSWQDNSDNEVGFKIERKENGGGWEQIATVGANVSSYTDSNALPEKTYSYRVRAHNNGGNSDYSSILTVTTPMLPMAKEASSAIDAARYAITQEISKGYSMAVPEDILTQAEQSLENGNFETARELAEQAESLAIRLGKAAPAAEDAIEVAKSSIAQEKSKGFNTTKAEHKLSQAETDLELGNYDIAWALASEAKDIAMDIDQDGILNEEDFAPLVKDGYIYAGVAAFAISLIVIASVTIHRKRLARQAIEKDKLKQKAEIIDMIDEALEKDRR